MAKNLDPKKLLISVKKENSVDIADSIVKRIHEKTVGEKESMIVDETTRTTIDIPKNVYKQIRLRTIELESSIKDYILGLVQKDLNE